MSRLVVVTGGNRGLGLACARAFARSGDRPVVTWRSEPIDEFPAVRCDVSDPAALDGAFDRIEDEYGPVDVLIANAGFARRDLVLHERPETFSEVVATNLVGAFGAAKRAVQSMVRRRTGAVVFVSSVAALAGTPGLGAYTASKAGLIGLARTLAREVGKRGITVNVVAPGILANWADDLGATDAWVRETPLGRVGTVDEAAAVVHFVAGASYITGAVVPVDGGYAMGIT